MNKIVILMRHGEAGYALRDFDRPLGQAGIEKCQSQGLMLRHQGVHLSALVSSPAIRSFSSAVVVASVMDYAEKKIITDDKLYNAPAEAILGVIQAFEDTWHTVLLVGHNPGISSLARSLCPGINNDLDAGDLHAISFPLLHWSDIVLSQGQLVTYA
jgi:phosphohistidine phosphatase